MSPTDFRRLAVLAGTVALAAWGCTEKIAPPTGPAPTRFVTPDSIQSVFTNTCIVCHDGPTPPAGLNLSADSSYAHLIGVVSFNCSADLGTPTNRVQPGVADSSCLYIAITVGLQSLGGETMPLGGPPLSQPTIDRIRNWITNGAPATEVPL